MENISVIKIPVAAKFVHSAKRFRATREDWSNKTNKAETRWVGDLGELIFHVWLLEQRIEHWWDPHANRKYDFLLGDGQRVEVKTMARLGTVMQGYTHSVNETQYQETEADHWFFASYEEPSCIMHLVGGCTNEVMAQFRVYQPGEWIHESYQVLEQDGGMRNVEYNKLTPTKEWLEQFK